MTQTSESKSKSSHFINIFFSFWPFIDFIDRTAGRNGRKQDAREGEWHTAKGTQDAIRTRGHRSEDRASALGTPALPTELNGASSPYIFEAAIQVLY